MFLHNAPAEHVPFADASFDLVSAYSFLHHTEDVSLILKEAARVLKSGARFVIETGMAAESLLPKFEAETSHQVEDIFVTIKEQYLAVESCVESEYIFERGGTKESCKAVHWIYTAAEIGRMLERAGFSVREMFGSLKREPFVLGSQELFVIAERVSEARL